MFPLAIDTPNFILVPQVSNHLSGHSRNYVGLVIKFYPLHNVSCILFVFRYAFLGMCLLGRAQFYQLLGQHATSIRDFTEIVDIAQSMYGQHHLQVELVNPRIAQYSSPLFPTLTNPNTHAIICLF